jgi:2-oxoglutarate ferredoxin oxidoreductase subunit delta
MPDTIVITVDSRTCKKCGICVEFCPRSVLGAGPLGEVLVLKPEACSECRLCELRCPDLAITVEGG